MDDNRKNAESKTSKYYMTLIIVASAAAMAGFFYFIFPFNIHIAEEKGPVKIYIVEHIAAVHSDLIDEFNRLHKGKIEVEPLHFSLDKYTTNERKELLSRYMRGKSEKIDVLSVDIIWAPRFAKWCEPFGPNMEKLAKDSLLSYALNTCYIDGRLYAMPLHLDMGLLYYRKDILQKLPDYPEIERKLKSSISWEELLKLRARLKVENPFYIFQGDNFEGLTCNYVEAMSSLYKKKPANVSIDLNSQESRQAFRHFTDLVNKYKASPKEVADFNEISSYVYYLNNDAVFIRGWSVFRSLFNNKPEYAEKLKNIGIAALPHFEGREFASAFGGRSLMISKSSTHKEEALEFIKFLISKNSQERLFEFGEFIPANMSVYSDTAFMAKNPDLRYYSSFFTRGVYRPKQEDYTRVSDITAYYLNAAIKGTMTVDEAITKGDNMIRSGSILIY
ncbi:MAG TPA: extracellular solute-binding protein [Ignavibacteriales bacterium]|nr:extracellular solute-binding protein [Ignavibacteriales bacterium]